MIKNEIYNQIDTLKEIYIKIRKEIIKKLDPKKQQDQQDDTINIYFNKSSDIISQLEDRLEKDAEDKSHSVIELEKNRELIQDIKNNFEKLHHSYESNIKNLEPSQNLLRRVSQCNVGDIVELKLTEDKTNFDVSNVIQLQMRSINYNFI
jgi:hypothetical protein